MKRTYIGNKLFCSIDVFFEPEIEQISATDIVPLYYDDAREILNEQAYADYVNFLETIEEIFDLYDFNITFAPTSSKTSRYIWTTRNDEILADNVPCFIRLRVSDHVQSFSERGDKLAGQKDKDFAEKIKRPASKSKQRYKLKELIVNKDSYSTYEEALNVFETMIREWLSDKGVDVESQFGPMDPW